MKRTFFSLVVLVGMQFPAYSQVIFTVAIPSVIGAGSNFTAQITLSAGGSADYAINNIVCTNCTAGPTPISGIIPATGATINITFTAGNSGTVQVSANATGGNGINDCNPCTASSLVVALPVELTRFQATTTSNVVNLDWTTASEQNNEKFVVERSKDGQAFMRIGEVAGSGTSYSDHNYNFIDKTPLPGNSYYRLKQVDFDGNFEFGPIETVAMMLDGGISIYPTIVQNELTVSLPKNAAETTELSIYSMQGALVFHQKIVGAGMLTTHLPEMAPGQYMVEVVNGFTLSRNLLFKQ